MLPVRELALSIMVAESVIEAIVADVISDDARVDSSLLGDPR
jgi:hypothetical protein